MTQAITINLPDRLFSQLKRAAELSHQPVENIIEQSMTHSLPPLLDDIPAEYQRDVYPLLRMSPQQLQAEAQLTELRREADVLMLRKAYAAVLLKRQGYQPPDIDV